MPLAQGQTLNNRYTVSALIGQGAMGKVYRATDTQTGQDVAVKVIGHDLSFDPGMLERFRREGEALRQLRHPNIVGFVETFEHAGQLVIVMECVSGGSLHELIKQGPLPIERARRIALELCDALTRAHHLNIIHRDIKPENILLAADGTPRLTDFGLARLMGEGTRLTGTGTQLGTPYYMSPEAWEGKRLDAQADVWSLGVVIFEMLSGDVPFSGDTIISVMNRVLNAPLPDLKKLRPDIPSDLVNLVRRMLTRDKQKRYASLRQVAADLEQVAAVKEVARETVSQKETERKMSPRRVGGGRRWGWVLGGAVGLALVLLLVMACGLMVILVSGSMQTAAATQAAQFSATPTAFVVVAQRATATPTPVAARPTATAKKVWTYADLTVGFIQTGNESGWRAANTASFKEAAQQLGITLKFYQADNKLENQLSAFRQFIADKDVNVIVLAALDPTGWDDVLQEAKSAGKVVVLEDRRIDAPENLYATYVGSDFVEEGRKAAEAMCTLLVGSTKKNVVELVGNVGASAAVDRGRGFREKMGDCGITITQSQTGNWSAAESKVVMGAFLKQSKDIQGVYAQNDEMALGAIQAIKEAGLKPGTDIKIVSVDAMRYAFDAMVAGDLNVTVECNPDIAPQVYEAALKALNGEALPKWLPTQEDVFWAKDAAAILSTRKY